MDEDWRNAFGILICTEICNGAGAGYMMARHPLALVQFVKILYSYDLSSR